MQKLISVLCLTAAATLAVPAGAQAEHYRHRHHHRVPQVMIHHERTVSPVVPSTAGVATGTVAALGAYNAWWGTGAFASALPATAAGSAAFGGVVGVGALALVDAMLQPCRGFAAVFDLSHGECVNGEYVGPARPVMYR